MNKAYKNDDKTLDKTSCQICGMAVDVVNVGPPVSFWCQQCHDTNDREWREENEAIKREMLRLPLPVILADGDGAVYRVLKTAQYNGFLAAIKTIAMSPRGTVLLSIRNEYRLIASAEFISKKIGVDKTSIVMCRNSCDVQSSLFSAMERGR